MAAELPWEEGSVRKTYKSNTVEIFSYEASFDKHAHSWKKTLFKKSQHSNIDEYTFDLNNLNLKIKCRYCYSDLRNTPVNKEIIIFEYIGEDAEKFASLNIPKPKSPRNKEEARAHIKTLYALYMRNEEIRMKKERETQFEVTLEDCTREIQDTVKEVIQYDFSIFSSLSQSDIEVIAKTYGIDPILQKPLFILPALESYVHEKKWSQEEFNDSINKILYSDLK